MKCSIMPDFSAAIVTYIDSDTPFQWGLELDRVSIPMIIFTSSSYYEELKKVKNSHVFISVYFAKTFKNTTFEKLLLLEDACQSNTIEATHLYWLDPEYMQSALSFEFLYSSILQKWLSGQCGELQVFFQHGYRHDMFFGGEVGLLTKLCKMYDELTISLFQPNKSISLDINHLPTIIEFDNGGANTMISEVVSEPVIHIAGDSHTLYSLTPLKAIGARNNIFVSTKDVSEQEVPYGYQFTHHIGAHTMYTMSKGELITDNDLKRWNVKPKDFMLFVFGEIDVRCHIWKEVKDKGRLLDEVVESLVINYINYVKNLGSKASTQVGVFGATPPLEPDNYSSEHKAIIGSIDERVVATCLLNKKLEEHARQNGIFYFDVYSLYASERGDLINEKSDSFCHISHYYKQPGLDYFYNCLCMYVNQ